MPKIKTKKSAIKRFKKTAGGKLLRRYSKQNHFNTRETGKFKRLKRKEQVLSKSDAKNVIKVLPYN